MSALSAQEKSDRARRVLRALYAKRAPAPVLRRAERLNHKLSCAAFVAKHMAAKTEET
jgi:hypothetical protein